MGDLSESEIIEILDFADNLKMKRKKGEEYKPLAGKKLRMIFQKASTRTRVSFETGMCELGGYPLFLSSNGEEITAEVFEAHARVIFDEAENRLHAQKAIMTLLMS